MTLPYMLYNDVDRELHIDFAGPIMMGNDEDFIHPSSAQSNNNPKQTPGAYVNGTAYLNNPPPVGCLAYP